MESVYWRRKSAKGLEGPRSMRFGTTTASKYIHLAGDSYCPACPRHNNFSLLFEDFPTSTWEKKFFNVRMEIKGTRIYFYILLVFESSISQLGRIFILVGTLGQKHIFRFRVKLKAEVVSVEEWGKGFFLYRGVMLLSKQVLLGRHPFREEMFLRNVCLVFEGTTRYGVCWHLDCLGART